MSKTKECIAMLLAGGQGSRLNVLTKNTAKPALPFGGKYRIIDFPLSNCINSGIDTVGVLTQYQPLELNSYIGNGQPWDLDRANGGVSILPPYMTSKAGAWYKGTANAIYQNLNFIRNFKPKYVLILSGDHIYKMDYSLMLKEHIRREADCTIAVIDVPKSEASRFGIMNLNDDNSVYEFEEKPKEPKSTKASMGIYIFDFKELEKYLIEDEKTENSHNDFGKDIIPKMLSDGRKIFAYEHKGYWKDVGTIESLWSANMDALSANSGLALNDRSWRIYAGTHARPPMFISEDAVIKSSIMTEGCELYGEIENSVIFHDVKIGKGCTVKNSVILPGSIIDAGASVENSIIAENVRVCENAIIGKFQSTGHRNKITVVGKNLTVGSSSQITRGAIVSNCTSEGEVII